MIKPSRATVTQTREKQTQMLKHTANESMHLVVSGGVLMDTGTLVLATCCQLSLQVVYTEVYNVYTQ